MFRMLPVKMEEKEEHEEEPSSASEQNESLYSIST